MTTKTATPPTKITRQALPEIMKAGPGWDPRITKYISKEAELKKMRADPPLPPKPAPCSRSAASACKRLARTAASRAAHWNALSR
jgi:hypothetical protein